MNMKCIGKGNMKVFIETGCNYASVSVHSYDVMLMWYEVSEGIVTHDFFNKNRYTSTTTRHQGYAANIYVQMATAKDPVKFLRNFGVKDLVYMDVNERKHWNLI